MPYIFLHTMFNYSIPSYYRWGGPGPLGAVAPSGGEKILLQIQPLHYCTSNGQSAHRFHISNTHKA